MKILHVIATPRGRNSNTLMISNAFFKALEMAGETVEVTKLDLFSQDLDAATGDNIETKYGLMMGQPIDPAHKESWARIERMIKQFMAADTIVISAPLWNFSIPYALKYYIDCIIQPGYLFRYNEQGMAEGLATGKKMICFTSRGADCSDQSPMKAMDFVEPYLRTFFGFVGISDIPFINAQPMDMGPHLKQPAAENATNAATELAKGVTRGIAAA